MNKKLNHWKNTFFILIILTLTIIPLYWAQGDITIPEKYYKENHQESYQDYIDLDFIKQFILIIIISVIITTLFELPVFYLFLRNYIKFLNILKISLIINIITVPFLWIFIFLVMAYGQNKSKVPFPSPSIITFITVEIIGEILVFIIEAILIFILLKILFKKHKINKIISFAKSALISFCANLVSATMGTAIVILLIEAIT